MTTTFNVGGTIQIEASITDGRVKATPGQSLKIDIYGFKYDIGGVRGTYNGAVAQSITDDDTNYVYLDSSGTLQINTTGYATDQSYLPLARVVAVNGEICNIIEDKVLLASSAAAEGTCRIGFPVDGGVRGGDSDGVSSNNNVCSLTFGSTGLSRNRWNFRPPQNYISGDLTLRIICSVAGSPGSNGMRLGLKYQGVSIGEILPSDYNYSTEQTKSLSGISNDELFLVDFTIPSSNFDKTEDLEAMELYRDSDHDDDDTSLTLHIHIIELRYTGYKVAGQSGQ